MKVAIAELNSKQDKLENFSKIEFLTKKASIEKAKLISFPEYSLYMDETCEIVKNAEENLNSPFFRKLSALAKVNNIKIHMGSIAHKEGLSQSSNKCFNSSFIFNEEGKIISRYDKINLFNYETKSGDKYSEGDYFLAGNEVKTIEIDNIKFGLSICFDLRFSELYRNLFKNGAKVLLIPAAFTSHTGKDHWEVLLKARAIENQCFVIAAAQNGVWTAKDSKTSKACFGHSSIIDPWGNILCQLKSGEELGFAELDFSFQDKIREKMRMN